MAIDPYVATTWPAVGSRSDNVAIAVKRRHPRGLTRNMGQWYPNKICQGPDPPNDSSVHQVPDRITTDQVMCARNEGRPITTAGTMSFEAGFCAASPEDVGHYVVIDGNMGYPVSR